MKIPSLPVISSRRPFLVSSASQIKTLQPTKPSSSFITTKPKFKSNSNSKPQRASSSSIRYYSEMATQNKKNPRYGHLPLSTSGPIECALVGSVLLNHSYFNKGSAFPADERQDFNLSGLLPQRVQTLEQQAGRAYEQYSSRPDNLAKNTFLTSMKEQNQVLYYKVREIRAVIRPRETCLTDDYVGCGSSCTITWTRCSASSTRQPKAMPSRISHVFSDVPRDAS